MRRNGDVLLPLGTLARQFTAQSLSQGQQFWSDKVKAQKRALLGLKSFAPTPRAMQLFSAEPHVQAVGLCDSRAMGRHRQSSDVDACIEASEMSHQGRLHPELSTDLEQHLQRVGQCIWNVHHQQPTSWQRNHQLSRDQTWQALEPNGASVLGC
jgi:hypothetical protein